LSGSIIIDLVESRSIAINAPMCQNNGCLRHDGIGHYRYLPQYLSSCFGIVDSEQRVNSKHALPTGSCRIICQTTHCSLLLGLHPPFHNLNGVPPIYRSRKYCSPNVKRGRFSPHLTVGESTRAAATYLSSFLTRRHVLRDEYAMEGRCHGACSGMKGSHY